MAVVAVTVCIGVGIERLRQVGRVDAIGTHAPHRHRISQWTGRAVRAGIPALAALRAGLCAGVNRGLPLALPCEHLDHPAHRAAAMDGRNVAAHDFNPVHLVKHEVLQANGTRGVLFGDGHTVDQHQHLQGRRTAQEGRGLSTPATRLGELKTRLARQQGGQVQHLRLLDGITPEHRGVGQHVGQDLLGTAGGHYDFCPRVLRQRSAAGAGQDGQRRSRKRVEGKCRFIKCRFGTCKRKTARTQGTVFHE